MKFSAVKPILILTLIFLQSSFGEAQNRTEEKRLKDSAGSYSFLLPTGFESKQSDEGFALVNAEKSFLVAVKAHNFQNFEKFAEQANLAKDGFSLIGEIQDLDKQNKTFRASKQTAQGLLVTDTFLMFSPFGGGVLIVALANEKNAESAFETALKISKSVNFSKPEIGVLSSQLQNLFRGKHLLYLYTSSGFSERTDIYLCPSGSFIYQSNSSSLSANGTGAAAGNSNGNWTISALGNNASLILQFNNGNRREYKISSRQAGNEIGLNGNRYFVQNHNQCR